MSNHKRRGLTTEAIMRALPHARDGARILYVCCHVGSARRAHGIAEDLARDAEPHPTRLRLDFRSGGRLSFAAVGLDPARVDPLAAIVLDHAALTRADPFVQNDWAALAAERGPA